MKYKIWDKESNLVTPTMRVMTPADVFEEFPAAEMEGMKFIVCDSPVSMGVFMELETTKAHYAAQGVQFEEGMTDQEVLDAITVFEETPVVEEPSAVERIAAMYEYQTIMSMPLAEEE